MFDIRHGDDGRVAFIGRLDASQVDGARKVLQGIATSCTLDFAELEYISSLGLGVLLEAQKRLTVGGHGLTIANLSPHIRDLFELAGFDLIFKIE